MPLSPRLEIPVPVGADAAAVPADLDEIVDVIDPIMAVDLEGLIGARPAAADVVRGTYYFATDEGVLYRRPAAATWIPIGQAQHTVGDLKGSLHTGDHDGWLWADARTNIARNAVDADFVTLMLALGYPGNDGTMIGLPDLRGRTLFGRGTHADVDTLGENEGLVVGSRRPKHRHTVTDPGHDHPEDEAVTNGLATNGGGVHWSFTDGAGGDDIRIHQNGSGAAATGISVGTAGAALDQVPFFVGNVFVYAGTP